MRSLHLFAVTKPTGRKNDEATPKKKSFNDQGWTRESFQQARRIIKAALPSDLESLLGPWLLLRGVQGGERVRYSLSPPRSIRYPSATLSCRSPPFPPNQPTIHPSTHRRPRTIVPPRPRHLKPPSSHPSHPPTPCKHTHTEAPHPT